MTEHFHTPGMAFLIGVVALLIVAAAVVGNRRPGLARIKSKPLMTENEASFFLRLERALHAYRVFPQVSFAAFLTHDGKLEHANSPKAAAATEACFRRCFRFLPKGAPGPDGTSAVVCSALRLN